MNDYNMIKEIRDQPNALGHVLENRSRIREIAQDLKTTAPTCYLIGCGSSYYAAMIGSFYHEYAIGLDSRSLPSSEFVWYAPVANLPSAVLLALSRSGRSSETVEAARKARRIKMPTVAITTDPTSTLGQECDYSLNIGVDEQSHIMTKSFTTSALCAILIGLELARPSEHAVPQAFEDKLRQLPRQASDVAETVDEQSKRTAEVMNNLERFVYLGSGANYAACLEGALKLRETSYSASEAYHTMEVRHGPFSQFRKGMGVIAVVPEDKTVRQTDTLLKEIASTGATVIPISNVPQIIDLYESSIRMPELISFELAPLLFMIPMQMLAYYYAIKRSMNPDHPRNLSRFVTTEMGP